MNRSQATEVVAAFIRLSEAVADKQKGPTITNDILRIDVARKQLIDLLTTDGGPYVSAQREAQSKED